MTTARVTMTDIPTRTDGGAQLSAHVAALPEAASHALLLAVLEHAANTDIRRAHLTLAADSLDEPVQRAWHLAGAALELDQRPARDVDAAGQARRLAVAAYLAASVVGDLRAAEALLADARRASGGSETSPEIALATAYVLLHGDGDVAAAHRLTVRAVAAAGGPAGGPLGTEDAVRLLAAICQLTGAAEHRDSLERCLSIPGAAFAASTRGAALGALDVAAAAARLDEMAELAACQPDSAETMLIAAASAFADRLWECRSALRRAMRAEAAQRSQRDCSSPQALQAGVLLALEAYQRGQFDEASQLADAASLRCARQGYHLLRQQGQLVLALVAASRGDAERAQAIADDIAGWAAARGVTSLRAGACYAGVLAALARSDFQAAYQLAEMIPALAGGDRHALYSRWALLDLVEAALRTERQDAARAYAAATNLAVTLPGSPRMSLAWAAVRAMLAPDDEAEALFDIALATAGAEKWPFDRARVALLAGERLRRMRAKSAARAHLSAALAEFRRLGAATWADRAAGALRATGQAPPRGFREGLALLTPQELEIARLAAAGLTNKQIAARLYISHRTVASHLLRIFPKLGITARAAIGRALPPEGARAEAGGGLVRSHADRCGPSAGAVTLD